MMGEFNLQETEIIEGCRGNHWLSDWGSYPTSDYNYSFRTVKTTEELKGVFEECSWSIRTVLIYADLAFVQQVNGGDEWLTLKKENGTYQSFESVSFSLIIARDGDVRFHEYLEKLRTKTIAQYWGREKKCDS